MGACCGKGRKNKNTEQDATAFDDKELKQIFDEFDVNGDGRITKNELRQVMRKMNQNPSEEELDAMFKAADMNNSGWIGYKEFKVIAHANPVGLSLRQVFDDMDADSDGHLSRSELRTAFEKLGHSLNDRQLNHIFKQVDIDSSGKISFDEFVLMMTKNPHN